MNRAAWIAVLAIALGVAAPTPTVEAKTKIASHWLDREITIDGELDEWREGKDVHFWSREQQDVVGKAVALAVRRALGK